MVRLAQDALERSLSAIERLNPQLNALVAIDEGGARAAAERLDATAAAGDWAGLLHGLVVTVKDTIDVAGLPTTNGNPGFFNDVAEQDAEIVRRLRAAGAVILAKANLHEFAFGATTQNPHLGACRNPWDPAVIPGGSSGGSGAAVASGMGAVSIGSDTGGSVRIPAALNGVSGLRPTFGRISSHGSLPLSPEFDTNGPLARRVTDLARVFAAVAGYDDKDPHSVDRPVENVLPTLRDGVAGIRIGIPRKFFFEELSDGIDTLLEAALRDWERCGATLVEIEVPEIEAAQEHTAYVIAAADAASFHQQRRETAPEKLGADVRHRLEIGLSVSGMRYAEALRWRTRWRDGLRRLFRSVDLIVAPTAPVVAPRIDDDTALAALSRLSRFTYCFSAGAVPVLALPCGFGRGGLPAGMQLIGPWFAEGLLFRAGVAYQERTGWHLEQPALCRA
ncbi:MAG: hypothetical protein JWQ36_3413 [Enterovirga sp.]|nr:hypothetical protein [Enterovirga sp.]